MRIATLKLNQMRNFKSSKGLQSNYGSIIFASISLGVTSIVAGFADYPSGADGRVSLVLVISGFFLSSFAVLNFKGLRNFEVNKPSEVFSFSFYFLLAFIALQSVLLLASGVVDTKIDVAILESASGITTTAISSLNPEALPTSINVFQIINTMGGRVRCPFSSLWQPLQ